MKEKLLEIQKALKAPKSQYNTFGKYHYRNAEDILESVKKHLNDCCLTISDEVVMIGNRYYIKATATISDEKESISVSAYAREEESKKGMDGAQVSGAASSYARKYCLNGLLLIDDTKDADSTNTHGKDEPKPTSSEKKPIPEDVPLEPDTSAMVFSRMTDELQISTLTEMAGDYPVKKPIADFTATERLKFYKLLKSKEVK
jgi:hypothetical protein